MTRKTPSLGATALLLACVAALGGCGKDLKPMIAALEAELAKEKTALVAANAKLAKEEAALVAANVELAKEKAALVAAKVELAKEEAARVAANTELAKERAAFSVASAKLALVEQVEAARRAEADKLSLGAIQVGIVMKSGDTKPAANITVYLTRSRFSDLSVFAKAEFKLSMTPAGLWAGNPEGADGQKLRRLERAVEGLELELATVQAQISSQPYATPKQDLQRIVLRNRTIPSAMLEVRVAKESLEREVRELTSRHTPEIIEALEKDAASKSTTDFNGVATFSDVQKGSYWVICRTSLGGGAVLEKKITISSSKFQLNLTNSEILENFK